MGGQIDHGQPLPAYVQLKTLLLEEILAGKYGASDRLPTEHELSAMYSISRTPVHRALAELAEEGVILRRRRIGSFVNPHWVQTNRGLTELRVVVPEGPWEDLVRDACPAAATLNVATVALEDLHQVLIHAVAEGRAPDLALLDSVWVPEFAASGFLWPLDELDHDWLHTDFLADAVEPFRSANRWAGRVVAVPAEADVVGLWYRRDVLAEAGLAPPGTWAELAEVGRALRRMGFDHPLVLPTGFRGAETTTYCLMGLLGANGATLLDDDEVTLDSPATCECLAMLADLVADGVLARDTVTFEYDRGARLLAQGDAALLVGGSYELRMIEAETGLDGPGVWEQFGFAAPPRGPRPGPVTLAGGMVHAIFRQAQNPHLAMALVRQVSARDALAEMSRRTGQLASRRSAADLAARDSEFLEVTSQMLRRAVLRPATRTYPRVSTQLQVMLESVLVGRLDPATAAARTAEMVSAITGLPVRSGR